MARKGGSKHLKRLPAPVSWPIHRKESKWVVKPKAGPHSLSKSLPLLLVIRELLKLVKDRREAKKVLSEGHVKVNGKVRRKDDYPVGLMDVIEIPALKKVFNVLPSRKGLRLYAIKDVEKDYKLCKIVGKTTVEGGHLQLHVHDGRSILIKVGDPKNPVEDVYKVHDILKVGIPHYEIMAHLKFEEGIIGIVERGKNMGRVAQATKILRRKWPPITYVTLQDVEGNQFETILDYVFPIGKGEPWLTLPEGSLL